MDAPFDQPRWFIPGITRVDMAEQSESRISVGDDPEHEELTAEICFRDQFVAMVSQEDGPERGVG